VDKQEGLGAMQQLLDSLPLWAVYCLIVVVLLLAFEGGYALSKFWERRRPDKAESSVGALSGATLGLLAFLLAFVTSSAVDNFKARREAESAESRQLLRDYVDTRLTAVDPAQTAQAIERSETIQQEL
jgi:hypothetical protein